MRHLVLHMFRILLYWHFFPLYKRFINPDGQIPKLLQITKFLSFLLHKVVKLLFISLLFFYNEIFIISENINIKIYSLKMLNAPWMNLVPSGGSTGLPPAITLLGTLLTARLPPTLTAEYLPKENNMPQMQRGVDWFIGVPSSKLCLTYETVSVVEKLQSF